MFHSGAFEINDQVDVAWFVRADFQNDGELQAPADMLSFFAVTGQFCAPFYYGSKKALLTLCKKIQTVETAYRQKDESSEGARRRPYKNNQQRCFRR